MALHLCDLVHIAGFGYPEAYNKKQTIHYYEQITLKSMAVSGPIHAIWVEGHGVTTKCVPVALRHSQLGH